MDILVGTIGRRGTDQIRQSEIRAFEAYFIMVSTIVIALAPTLLALTAVQKSGPNETGDSSLNISPNVDEA
jgi:hypothetical protein